jgi:hypothetical protein
MSVPATEIATEHGAIQAAIQAANKGIFGALMLTENLDCHGSLKL